MSEEEVSDIENDPGEGGSGDSENAGFTAAAFHPRRAGEGP